MYKKFEKVMGQEMFKGDEKSKGLAMSMSNELVKIKGQVMF